MPVTPAVVTRFAPSPTGRLHIGHAFSALTTRGIAARQGGTCLLRIEDLDTSRCRANYETGIFEDLEWIGFDWPEPVLRQSDRGAAYAAALSRLGDAGLLYPCRCSRAEIRAALAAPQEGSEVPAAYPGTCRSRTLAEAEPGDALRLDLAAALGTAGAGLAFEETGPLHRGRHVLDAGAMAATIGDPVLGRRDIGVAYHLAVVVDDAAQGVTHVVRGADLLPVTPLHRLLQELLGLTVPVWHHHELLRDAGGRRLAKRDGARAIATLRAEAVTPDALRAQLGFAW